jgi:hypothetical protein
MADMHRTLKVIHFAAQLCGMSPYGSFLGNGGYETPVLCRKYLFYCFTLIIAISVVQLHFVIFILRMISSENSDVHRVSVQITWILVSCIFTTYLISAITRLIGQRNFFKISRKLLSVGSFVNYREGTVFSNAVIALHVLSFVTYLLRYSVELIQSNGRLSMLLFVISAPVCETITSFAALQFLYFVFTVRRHFMLLNSSLNEVVVSTVKSECVLSLKVRTVSDFLPGRSSVNSGIRDMLYRHVMLCDIFHLISSSYALQVLALIGSKFVYATICLYLLFFWIVDRSVFIDRSFSPLLPLVIFEVMQLVTVLYCCQSATSQVGII